MNNQILSESKTPRELITYLRSPIAIRQRCMELFVRVRSGDSSLFSCDLDQLDNVANYVIEVIRTEYPDLKIPFHSRWRHFEAGGIPRLLHLNNLLSEMSPLQKAISKFDLAIISVLLDAGAGSRWKYYEEETELTFVRSEGLALASFRLFCQGGFSADSLQPFQADAKKLQGFAESYLATEFQVSADNYLVGLSGRCKLLQKLGKVLFDEPEIFGTDNPRPGNLLNYLLTQSCDNKISATKILKTVLKGFSEIWQGRVEIGGSNLGDVWYHPAVSEDGFVPFHKLSQWLTYSLLEPLQELGYEITDLETLTGLTEYRNGGLCIDLGLINVKRPQILHSPHKVSSEVIVEWRALTLILLDKIADTIRNKLSMSAEELPLPKILQGGTWLAGRKIAYELRSGGVSPIQIESDGTVF
ncbi:MAG: URC4/urg3 family protein [Cyanobacteria bacterium P01_A01_bin.84]